MTGARVARLLGGHVTLASKVGSGGEGSVWRIEEDPGLVAKLMHEAEDAARKSIKVRELIKVQSPSLLEVAAWPVDELVSPDAAPVGFLMPRIPESTQLFSAYQIKTRRQKLPQATFAFLVRAARNLAICVQRLHDAGFVLGDLNESNTLVDGRAMVTMIDVDSIQVVVDGRVIPCPVAKLELLAPELQGKDLEIVPRTQQNDLFPLAVLIFHLLVFGRHPYAGRVKEGEPISLEAAIGRHAYAYTRRRSTPLIPPPGMDLEHLSPAVAELFEDAFDGKRPRPTAHDWFQGLQALEEELVDCPDGLCHVHWTGLAKCPWCKGEQETGLALFGVQAPRSNTESRLAEVDALANELERMPQPGAGFTPTQPILVEGEASHLNPIQKFGASVARTQVLQMAAFSALGSGSIVLALNAAPVAAGFLAAGALIALAPLWSGFSLRRREVLRQAKEAMSEMEKAAEDWHRALWVDGPASWRVEALELARRLKDEEDDRLSAARLTALRTHHSGMLASFLRRWSVIGADAPTIGAAARRQLYGRGIQTADDVSEGPLRQTGVLNEAGLSELLTWRKTLESQYWSGSPVALTPPQHREMVESVRRQEEAMLNRLKELIALLRQHVNAREGGLTQISNRWLEAEARLKLLAPELRAVIQAAGPVGGLKIVPAEMAPGPAAVEGDPLPPPKWRL